MIRPVRNAILRRLLASASVALILCASAPAQAQFTVFDPTNYSQNLLTAARALDQINNQIAGLENQAQMLINQARNLASLPVSIVARKASTCRELIRAIPNPIHNI